MRSSTNFQPHFDHPSVLLFCLNVTKWQHWNEVGSMSPFKNYQRRANVESMRLLNIEPIRTTTVSQRNIPTLAQHNLTLLGQH